MPIYDYLCDNGHRFETMQRMTDPALETCEVCGAPVRRVLHPVAVHFKGSGFYNTDYGRGKGAKADAGREGGESASKNGAGEGSSAKADTGASSTSTPSSSSSSD